MHVLNLMHQRKKMGLTIIKKTIKIIITGMGLTIIIFLMMGLNHH